MRNIANVGKSCRSGLIACYSFSAVSGKRHKILIAVTAKEG